MKVMEIRDHHSAAPKESKLRKLMMISAGLSGKSRKLTTLAAMKTFSLASA